MIDGAPLSGERDFLAAFLRQAVEDLRASACVREVGSSLRFFSVPAGNLEWITAALGLDVQAVRDGAARVARLRLEGLIKNPSQDPCSSPSAISDGGGGRLTGNPVGRAAQARDVLGWYLGRPWG